MFVFHWKEFSPPLSSAHRLLQCYHSQWEIGDAAIHLRIPPQPPATIGPLANERAVSSDVTLWRTLHILVGKICISLFLFYCEGMLSLVVLWLCAPAIFCTKWRTCFIFSPVRRILITALERHRVLIESY